MPKQAKHRVYLLFFIGLVALGMVLGQAVVIAFGVMGLVAGGAAWVWNRLSLEEVSYDRELSLRKIFVGEELSLTVALTNRKVVPLTWIHVDDDIPASFEVIEGDVRSNIKPGTESLSHSTSMAWYEKVSWNYRMRPTRRGFYRFGPTRMESGDPFGFLGSRSRTAGKDDVLVYPRVVPLEELGLPSIRPLGEVRGGIRLFNDPSRPSGLRAYEQGDPLKTVDWKATAKAQDLQVRTYEPSSSTNVILAVAVDTATPFWAAYEPVVLERVVTVAASVAAYASERKYNVGLLSNDLPIQGGRPLNVAPARGPEQLSLVLGALAIVRPYAIGPMYDQLADQSRRFPIGSTIVVCTAYLPPEFSATLQDLKGQGHKIVVLYAGEAARPNLGEGVLAYDLLDHLKSMEEVNGASARMAS